VTIRIAESRVRIMCAVTGSDYRRLSEWCNEVDARIASQQLATGQFTLGIPLPAVIRRLLAERARRSRRPYYGLEGGAYVYEFYRTSTGDIARIRSRLTGEELELTGYVNW
jgi:hypothetical protein